MGTFSIWHWAIVLLLIGVPVFFAVRSAAKPSQNPEALVGFGGWLMLLAIGQALSPLRTLAELGNSVEGYQQLMTVTNGALAVYGEIALLLAFLVFQVVVLVSMLRRSRRFPQLFLCQWFAIPVVFILDTVWISTILGVPVNQVLAGDALVTPIASFVVTGVWVAYVHKSIRVRNTFDRAGASGQVVSAP
jgi:Na+/phosphate symporter